MEDPPLPTLPLDEQVAAYRRLRETLQQEIRMNLLLTSRLAVLPQRK